MMKSPVHEQLQACYHEASGFDLHKDFSEFLEEPRQNVNEAKVRSSSVHPEEYGKTGLEKVKNEKKSWRSSLISWWEGNKKSKHPVEPTNNNNCESKVYVKNWRPTTSLFKSTSQIPYVSLHQQNRPRAATHNYGPLYVVT